MTIPDAVLVLGFNRPRLLRQLIDNLSRVRPPRIYVAIDGPRTNRLDDESAVAQCQEIANAIDWPAEVRTRFSETNLGCGRAVSSAIEWFLAHEERGIVLEDDVLPNQTFFDYCSHMLDLYADDDRVVTVNGHNLVPARGQSRPDLPYRFAHYTEMWGWALWRRTWTRYEFDISQWKTMMEPVTLWEVCGRSVPRSLFWAAMFDMVAHGQMDTWDIQLALKAMRCGQVMVVPNVNLTVNTGFGAHATHFDKEPPQLQPVEAMAFPISPVEFGLDENADRWIHRYHFQVEMRVQQIVQRQSPGFHDYVQHILELNRST